MQLPVYTSPSGCTLGLTGERRVPCRMGGGARMRQGILLVDLNVHDWIRGTTFSLCGMLCPWLFSGFLCTGRLGQRGNILRCFLCTRCFTIRVDELRRSWFSRLLRILALRFILFFLFLLIFF